MGQKGTVITVCPVCSGEVRSVPSRPLKCCSRECSSKHKVGIKMPPRSEKTRKKLSDSLKGRKVWNKGLKTGLAPWNKGVPCAEETKAKLREILKGRKAWNKGKHIKNNDALDKWRKNGGEPWNKGKEWSDEMKNKLSEGKKRSITVADRDRAREQFKNQKREKHPNWLGGRSIIDRILRKMPEYKKWRSEVFERDEYKCRDCNLHGYVTAHHVKSFSVIIQENKITDTEMARACPELWALNNGVTLCEDCHKKTDNYAGRTRKEKILCAL